MSKSRPYSKKDFEFNSDVDNYYEIGYYDELHERRKQKRLKNALRTRNFEELIELDEED